MRLQRITTGKHTGIEMFSKQEPCRIFKALFQDVLIHVVECVNAHLVEIGKQDRIPALELCELEA